MKLLKILITDPINFLHGFFFGLWVSLRYGHLGPENVMKVMQGHFGATDEQVERAKAVLR